MMVFQRFEGNGDVFSRGSDSGMRRLNKPEKNACMLSFWTKLVRPGDDPKYTHHATAPVAAPTVREQFPQGAEIAQTVVPNSGIGFPSLRIGIGLPAKLGMAIRSASMPRWRYIVARKSPGPKRRATTSSPRRSVAPTI